MLEDTWSRDINNGWWDPVLGNAEWWLFLALIVLLIVALIRPGTNYWKWITGATIAYLVVFAAPIGLHSHELDNSVRMGKHPSPEKLRAHGYLPPPGVSLLDTHKAHSVNTVLGIPFASMRLYRRETYALGPTQYTAGNALKIRTGLLPYVPPLIQTNGTEICGQRKEEQCMDLTRTRVIAWREGHGFKVVIRRRAADEFYGQPFESFKLTYGVGPGFWFMQWTIFGLLLGGLALRVKRRKK